LLKIVKHCHDSLPQMVTGSLLGLVVENGILEVTHAFPSPDSGASSGAANAAGGATVKDEDFDMSSDFQLEMMRMLREVNVDNNCVGWYQSMYLGIYSTANTMENQFNYQTDLSPNAIGLLYDPLQTANGNFVLKAFRLTEQALELKESGRNGFLHPSQIFEELPVICTNPKLAHALLQDYQGGAGDLSTTSSSGAGGMSDIALDRLDLSTHPYLEKHLEFLCGWVDELSAEQHKFQYYARHLARNNKNKGNIDESEKSTSWNSPDAPKRMESLLVTNQIRSYCDQMDKFTGAGLTKLFLTGGLHKEERSTNTAAAAASSSY
jgi:translation initiation factor 3 subunit H